jgi:hypothetical protein
MASRVGAPVIEAASASRGDAEVPRRGFWTRRRVEIRVIQQPAHDGGGGRARMDVEWSHDPVRGAERDLEVTEWTDQKAGREIVFREAMARECDSWFWIAARRTRSDDA